MILAKYLSPKANSRAWIEGFVIPCIALGLMALVSPHDPFSVKATFPWLWLAPVLVGLRYGLGPAVLSVAVLIGAFVAARYGLPSLHLHRIPDGQFLGGIILTLITGEYGSLWILRLRRSEQMSDYAKEQLEGLTRTLHMTRLSHDRLEQSVISKPVTLRNSLLDLRQLLAEHPATLAGDAATRLLHIAAYHGGFEQAAIYSVTNNVIDPTACAAIGQEFVLKTKDILVAKCLEGHRTAYWPASSLTEGEQSAYLVVAPIHTSEGTLLGILVVATMPFLFLNEENLLAISVLLAYFADDAYALRTAHSIVEAIPACPPRFAAEIVKLWRTSRELGIPSSLVVLFLADNPLRENILADLSSLSRGLDEIWQTTVGDTVALVTLMPFSSKAVAAGYTHRIKSQLKDHFEGIDTDHIPTRIQEIGADDIVPMLTDLLDPQYAA
ncbi:MAG TPA: PelD GGDEF domain-containing protein [Acidiferrobacter sp.]|nr:PelD GGDEF domain-containing protein [Acidiferrobacter sp.]